MKKRKEKSFKTGSAFRAAIASEEASSIPFPPGRRKLHIRSLLLPSQIVTVSLGHNLAVGNFTTPHAILMMAGSSLLTDLVMRATPKGDAQSAETFRVVGTGATDRGRLRFFESNSGLRLELCPLSFLGSLKPFFSF